MTAPGHLEVRHFPLPRPAPGAVLLKVTYSGICGTDKHTYRGESKQYAGTDHEREITYPLICGHENVGVIEAIGGADSIPDSEGRPLRPGDRIVPAANVPCGHCVFCLNDYPYYFCENLQDYGNSLHAGNPPHLFGGWAEYMYLLPGTPLFRVPDGLPDEVAALTEVMAVTHGFDRARMLTAGWGGSAFGESVAIVGIGPLGFCHLVKARLMGCGKLIAIDRLDSRLELAKKFGATLTINVTQTDEKERIALVRAHTLTGPDIVIDCSDNFATRHAVNAACVASRKPLVSGAAVGFDAQISVYDTRSPEAPCYACIFPPDAAFEEVRCATMGVFAPLVGIVGSMQAAEALKLLAGVGSSLAGRLQMLDARSMEWSEIRLARQPHCPVCAAVRG